MIRSPGGPRRPRREGRVAWSSAPAPSATPTVGDTSTRVRQPTSPLSTHRTGLSNPRRTPVPRPPGGGGLTDCPPQSGTVTADTPPSASPRSAVPAGTTSAPAGGTTGETRLSVPSPPPAGRRGSREPEPVDNVLGRRAAAGLAVGLAATPRPRRRLARPAAAPQPPPPAPNVRPPRPGGQPPTFGLTGLAARPQVTLERHHAAPSCGRGRRAMAAAPSAPNDGHRDPRRPL